MAGRPTRTKDTIVNDKSPYLPTRTDEVCRNSQEEDNPGANVETSRWQMIAKDAPAVQTSKEYESCFPLSSDVGEVED